MPAVKKKLLNGFEQYSGYYSVICVFGSVVGCVVVPLITQSIETIIFSAIIISLTAKTLHMHSRTINSREEAQLRLTLREDDRRKGRDGYSHEKKPKRKKVPAIQHSIIHVESFRRQREEDLLKLEEQRQLEREQRLEEKRLKKARKKEERLKRKEEELKIKMKEKQQRKEREEKRAQEKKTKKSWLESIDSLVRSSPYSEKKTSSLMTPRSSHSLPRHHPHRKPARPTYPRTLSDSNLSPPLSLSPSPTPNFTVPQSPSPVPQQGSPVQNMHSITHLEGTGLQRVRDKKNGGNVTAVSYKQDPNNLFQGQVYAVNPLAPFSSVTRAAVTQATITQTVEKGWNEPLYYWPLDQTGLVGSFPYQWSPVGASLNGQLASPNISQVAGSLFPPENMRMSNSPPSQFGSIGDSCGTTTTKATGHCSEAVSPLPVAGTTASSKGYSLFSDNTSHSLFGDSLFCGGYVTSTGQIRNGTEESLLVNPNEGSHSPTEGEPKEFDEWPAF